MEGYLVGGLNCLEKLVFALANLPLAFLNFALQSFHPFLQHLYVRLLLLSRTCASQSLFLITGGCLGHPLSRLEGGIFGERGLVEEGDLGE